MHVSQIKMYVEMNAHAYIDYADKSSNCTHNSIIIIKLKYMINMATKYWYISHSKEPKPYRAHNLSATFHFPNEETQTEEIKRKMKEKNLFVKTLKFHTVKNSLSKERMKRKKKEIFNSMQ